MTGRAARSRASSNGESCPPESRSTSGSGSCYAGLSEAQDEFRVVGHEVRRPGRLPGELDLDGLDTGNGRGRVVDALLDHRPRGTAHRRQAVHDLDLRAVDLDVVVQPQLDDVHAEVVTLDH